MSQATAGPAASSGARSLVGRWRRPRGAHWMQAGLVAAVMICTILAAALFNARVLSAIAQSRDLAIRASAEAQAVHQAITALIDVETGERGFLLTDEAAYLQPFESGRARLGSVLDRLQSLSSSDTDLSADVQILRALAGDKLREAERVVGVARAAGREAGVAALRSGPGNTAMDRLRDHTALLLARIGEDHDARLREVRAREALASWAGVATAVVCAALLGIVVLVLLRGRARLQRAQAALGAQTARLSGVIANMPDGLAVFDPDGRLTLANAQFASVTQLPPRILHEGATMAAIAAAAWPDHALEPPPSRDAPVAAEVQVGPRSFEIWRGRMPDDGQILVVADITRRARAEMIARQAQKMEALGHLTGGVAHDFNNLLQVVSANLELILMRLGDSPGVADRLAAALAAVGRAAQMTRHLLAFARRQPLAPAAIDTAELLRDQRELLRRTLGKGVVVELTMQDPWPIRADPQQLESAILNLALNGRDAMGGHGTLTIEATNLPGFSPDRIERGGRDDLADRGAAGPEDEAGDCVCIAITDTGTGMTRDQLERAVEPFYTTKTEGRGTGLGLPMVFGFAKQSNGHLLLSSEPGRGTTARLVLPRSPATPALPRPRASRPTQARGELVLVIEDDPTVRAASCQTLREFGYAVAEAEGAEAALRLLHDGLRPALLFSDIVMPGPIDVWTMTAQARAVIADLPVVYATGHSDHAADPPGGPVARSFLIGKPWRAADLAATLRGALQTIPPPRETAAAAVQIGCRAGRRVVLAEDDALIRMNSSEILAELGLEVIEAATGAEALRALQNPADLLITDLGLPDIDGLQVAAEALRQNPRLSIIIASGRGADPDSQHVWLQKPFDSTALALAVDRALTQPGGAVA